MTNFERPAVEFHDVGKVFRRSDVDRAPTLKRFVMSGFKRAHAERFWALRHVSGEIAEGKTVGLIGRNGAGKSTLLRLLAGVGRPDEGRITVRARVGALLELGKEFHPELSGRENALASGVVAGLSVREVEALLPEVVEFAELGAFIDQPLRTYSSGMQARLAFAIAVYTRPEVLFIDEVLAVGDAGFRQRCIDKLQEFQRDGVTMVLVSHDARLVRGLCDVVIWLRRGSIAAAGTPEAVEREYEETLSAETAELTPADAPEEITPGGVSLRPRENRFGSQDAAVKTVRILDGFRAEVAEVEPGAELCIDVEAYVPAALGTVNLGIRARRDDGLLCLDTSTPLKGGREGRAVATLVLTRVDLAPGSYVFDVGIYDGSWEHTYDLHLGCYPLTVVGETAGAVLTPPVIWTRQV